MRAFTLGFVVLLGCVSIAFAQDEPKSPPRPSPGQPETARGTLRAPPRIDGQVYIGERAPDFELDASNGRAIKLSALRGDWIVLAFAERRGDLAALRSLVAQLLPYGGRIVGVCHDNARTLHGFAARDSVPMVLLADVTGEISEMYGLFDYEHSATRPGFLVLDRDGVVRLAVLGSLPPAEEIGRFARFAIRGL